MQELAARCPACGASWAQRLRTAEELMVDARWSRELLRGRLGNPALLKDTAEFTQDYRTDLLACQTCGTLYRDSAALPADRLERYAQDHYDTAYLDRMWLGFLAGYHRDREWLAAHGVRPGARVLEIGSWFGAFLTYARHRGAHVVGVDLGTVAAEYARQHGSEVITEPFTGDAVSGRFDAVFALNCFEQLPDPEQAVITAARLLEPGGRLVIRTPNAAFVRFSYQRCPTAVARRLLAGTNLAGVAYAACYSFRGLARLLTATGFDDLALRGREHASAARRAFDGTVLAHHRTRQALYRAAGWPWMDVTATRRIASAP